MRHISMETLIFEYSTVSLFLRDSRTGKLPNVTNLTVQTSNNSVEASILCDLLQQCSPRQIVFLGSARFVDVVIISKHLRASSVTALKLWNEDASANELVELLLSMEWMKLKSLDILGHEVLKKGEIWKKFSSLTNISLFYNSYDVNTSYLITSILRYCDILINLNLDCAVFANTEKQVKQISLSTYSNSLVVNYML